MAVMASMIHSANGGVKASHARGSFFGSAVGAMLLKLFPSEYCRKGFVLPKSFYRDSKDHIGMQEVGPVAPYSETGLF